MSSYSNECKSLCKCYSCYFRTLSKGRPKHCVADCPDCCPELSKDLPLVVEHGVSFRDNYDDEHGAVESCKYYMSDRRYHFENS